MKLGITLLLLAMTSFANAQSLKDMLYKGKLKKDSTSVIRKTDDLSTKVVDTTKKEEAVVKIDEASQVKDSTKENVTVNNKENSTLVKETVTTRVNEAGDSMVTSVTTIEKALENEPPPPPPPAPVKSNNKIWKEHTDAMINEMKADVLSNKKVKKETYFLTVEYEIAPEGAVSILNVTASPENEFLQNQVKDRLINNSPVLAPVTDSAGKTRKVKRKYNFTITKE
jgi:hypothetical protein